MINEFSYRLKNSMGDYYKSEGSTLVIENTPIELEYAPDGWMQKTILWKRNLKNYGVIRGLTVPLQFVMDGAEILRYLFYEYGYEADCVIEICELNNSTRAYEVIYLGDIDFTTAVDSSEFFQVNAIEGGFQKIVKNKEDIVYEIPMAEADLVNVKLNGINFYSKTTFTPIPSQRRVEYTPPRISGLHLVPITKLSTEGLNFKMLYADQVLSENVSPGYEATSFHWMMKALENLEITISGEIEFEPGSYTDFDYELRLVRSDGTSEVITTLDETDVRKNDRGAYYGTVKKTFSKTLSVLENQSLFLQGNYPRNGGIYYRESRIFVEFINSSKTSYCKAMKPEVALSRLAELMGGSALSNLLLQTTERLLFTNLNCLANFEDKGVLKIKLSDLYETLHALYSATEYVDSQDRLRIEAIGEAFNQTQILDVGEVNNIKLSVMTELLFNQIQAGYPTYTYETVNGKYEFNSEQMWVSKVDSIKNTLDLKSVFRGDGYGIELTRLNLEGKTTTDSRTENHVFMLSVENAIYFETLEDGSRFEYYQLKRHELLSQGVIDNTVFNWSISPRHNLIRNSKLLKSLLWKSSPVLKLQTADKNTEVASLTFAENADIDLSNVTGLFSPVIIRFEPLVDQNLYPILKNNPHGLVKFSYLGLQFTGYIHEIGIQPRTGAAQQWTLISSVTNNLRLLSLLTSFCDGIYLPLNIGTLNATTDIEFYYEFPVSSKTPVNVQVISKPDWVTIVKEDNMIKISGTPIVVGIVTISLVLLNGCSSKSLDIPVAVSAVPVPELSVFRNRVLPSGIAEVEIIVSNSDPIDIEYSLIKKSTNDVVDSSMLSGVDLISFSGPAPLEFNTDYELRVRRKDGANYSPWVSLFFTSSSSIYKSYKIIGSDKEYVFINKNNDEERGYVWSNSYLVVCALEGSLITENIVALLGDCPQTPILPSPAVSEYGKTNLQSTIKTITYDLSDYAYPVDIRLYDSSNNLLNTFTFEPDTPYRIWFNRPDGSYSFTIRGFDEAGNYSNSQTISFTLP